MAKPNYSFEKRQRELAKKKKQDEKLAKKQAAKGGSGQDGDNYGDHAQHNPPADDGAGNTAQ